VCAYAINAGPGNANTQLGCQTVLSDPIGVVDSVARQPGGTVRVSGWAFDPDTNAPIDVGVFVNGLPWAAGRANVNRADLAVPLGSTDHGFDVVLQGLTTAPVNVCVFAINVGPGSHKIIGCRTIDARRNPIGVLDSVQVANNGIRVQGWALDPDTVDPLAVHVYVDGKLVKGATASATRADVGAAFPGWGDNHGFDVFVPNLWISEHDVCVYALNTGLGDVNPLVGCKRVRPAGEPFGSVDNLSARPGGINVAGWVIDPDTTAATQALVTVDGVGTTLAANQSRPDVGAAFPGFGAGHGFGAIVPASPGVHNVCVWGINVGRGMSGRILACRSVAV
jgi:hypothetical protein